MLIPKNYDEIHAKTVENLNLTLGGHICRVKGAEEYFSNEGKQSIKVTFDIDENSEYDGFFTNRAYTYWPQGGTKYLSMEAKNMCYFKQFVEAIQKSNEVDIDISGDKDIDLEQFVGLRVVCQFGLEEYVKNNIIKTKLKIVNFYPIDKIDEVPIPSVELIHGGFMKYEEYQKLKRKNI